MQYFMVTYLLLATLELFYHAVSILSCRPAKAGERAKSPRQMLSAIQVTRILDEDTSGSITLLPFVPYAVSLSLSTAYRELKFGKMALSRERASDLVCTNYKHLCRLRESFWSAAVMADMARRIIESGPTAGQGGAERSRHGSTLQRGPVTRDGSPLLPATRNEDDWDSRGHDVGPGEEPHSALGAYAGQGVSHSDSNLEIAPQEPQLWFEGFDTDLGDVDAFFEGNLDLGLPSFLPS